MDNESKQKAAFLDIDGTLHHGFATANFIYSLYEQGVITKKEIDAFDTLFNHDSRRHSQYELWGSDITRVLNSLFAGHTRDALKSYLQQYEAVIKKNLYTFTLPVVAFLKEQGYTLFLVTGAHDFVAEVFADLFAITYERVIATKLQEVNGILSNKYVTGYQMNTKDKKDAVMLVADTYNLGKSIALGDSESDIAMFSVVGKAFLFIDKNTLPSLIQHAEKVKACLINKDVPVEKVLSLIETNLP